jgi:hypothetical protein
MSTNTHGIVYHCKSMLAARGILRGSDYWSRYPCRSRLVGTGAALEIFDCAGLLCGRIVWPRKARNTAGRPVQDDENPDPTFRRRPPCGSTILHGLRPAGRDHWNSGSLYNLEDGQTYVSRRKPVRPMSSSCAFLSTCRCSVRPKTLQWTRGLGLDGRC